MSIKKSNLLTPAQCRGARAMLRLDQKELARRARVSHQTVVDFERGARTPYERTLRDLRGALEDAGIELLDENDGGLGVRFRQ